MTDDTLSNKLQSEANLTLTTAVDICRRQESAKQAHTVVHPQVTGTVDMVKRGKHQSSKPKVKSRNNNSNNGNAGRQQHARAPSNSNSTHNKQKQCHRCGKGPHSKTSCPAINSICNHCQKIGHWKVVCRQLLTNGREVTTTDDVDNNFLDEVKQARFNNLIWSVKVNMLIDNNNEMVRVFKLDVGR